MKGLTDIPGIRVGHASDFDGLTGCTVIVCESGAVAGGDIGGAATGTQEFDLLSPLHLTPRIHAVCLAGGSAFGLEAASGVRRYLEKRGVGFEMGSARVPLVPAAILYDLGIGKASVRPTREMGEAAAAAANTDAVKQGCIGAGTGATVGKVNGITHAMKSGLGSFTVQLSGKALVAAVAAVNAFGDVIEPGTGKIVAGARISPDSAQFAGTSSVVKRRRVEGTPGQNTTLVVVATNVRLTKPEATRLARVAQHGLVKSISPVHTNYDGDVVIALSSGSEVADFTALSEAAADAVAESVLRAVRYAVPMGGLPAIHK